MSIKKRLILSNIGMILLPLLLFILIELIFAYFMFYPLEDKMNADTSELFLSMRLVVFIISLLISNVVLSLIVSKSIIVPLIKLKEAAYQIGQGNLDIPIETTLARNELNELSQSFEAMRIKLKAAEELQHRYEENQKELIANISHDLKTPLTSIKGYIQGVSDGVANTPEKMQRYIQTIENKTNDMNTLIDELMLYSKLDLPNVPYKMERINLVPYLKEHLKELQFRLTDENLTISLEYDSNDIFKVKADKEKLNRVITNIIQNSLKYINKETKQIKIHLISKENEVLIEITDNGSGVSQQEIPYLFNRFYRTDISRNSSTGGSGLGLSIAKKIIEGHGGVIGARSEISKYFSVFFTLQRP
ncbi:HAMP domain-containing histidine kinase [Sporosarcina sp. E16_3]|uniref:sensor histidine kinase n=1 Tax=Sporosarcina sp. E16_3 TaxID=2789293 RepID=UPI001A92A4F0|nr:HAMP domain-containing sensor histidine kinase [Sporosarcina sp. E16_3]MBO0603597.1 HAMP domain-containing histidine kinase [Sporosarcina sp. E16_3]